MRIGDGDDDENDQDDWCGHRASQVYTGPAASFSDHYRSLSALVALPIGSLVVPFCGLYLDPYKAIPKRNYLGAYGYEPRTLDRDAL